MPLREAALAATGNLKSASPTDRRTAPPAADPSRRACSPARWRGATTSRGRGITMEHLIGGAVTHWLGDQPVRNLADWLSVIAQRQRLSLRAAHELLTDALAAEAGASLLLMAPSETPRSVPADWGRSRPAPPPSMRVTRSNGRQQRIPTTSRACEPLDSPSDEACGPLAALAAFNATWDRRRGAGTVDGLRAFLRGGAGLGVTDEAARRLWPALFVDELAQVQSPAVAERKARPRPGTPVPGLPSDAALARELADEEARRPHGAMKRLAEKYGCVRSTLQRRVNKGRAALQPSFFPRVAGGKR